MIQIEAKLEKRVTKELAYLIDSITSSDLKDFNAVGGRSASNVATDFHLEFNKQGNWRGDRYMKGTAGKSGDWGVDVANGWSFREADTSGAVIANDAAHYAFKVRGTPTITPKRASALTIPLIPEAKGRRAADYEIDFDTKLFRPKGKNVLMEKTEDGGVRSVYALVKSVTMEPMPEALPPTDLIADGFAKGWIEAFIDKLEAS